MLLNRRKYIDASPAASPQADALALFGAGDDGDLWEFNPANTDASADGDPITTATGLKNSYVLANAGNPTLKDMGGGKWAADFDGVGDRLEHTFGTALVQPGTIVMACYNVDTNTHVMVTGGTATSRWQISNDSGGDLIAFAGAEIDTFINEGWLSDTRGHIYSVVFNGTSSDFRVDGARCRNGANLGAYGLDKLVIGGQYDGTLHGTFQCFGIMVIDRVLSTSELKTAERWARSLTARALDLPAGCPSSVNKLVLPSDLTFSGGVLTDINPSFGPKDSRIVITGSPAEGSYGGWSITEATGTGNRVNIWPPEIINNANGSHLAILYARNATADTQAVFFGGGQNTRYGGVAESGSSNTTQLSNMSISSFRADDATTVANNASRGTFYTKFYASSAGTIRAMAAMDFGFGFDFIQLGVYTGANAFIGEIEILGWAVFDDASQVDDVIDYLIANA